MKKFMSLIIAVFLLSLAGSAGADSVKLKLWVNGEELATKVSPQIVDGQVLVPFAALAERLGATVEWDQKKNRVNIETEERDDLKSRVQQLEEILTPEDPWAAVESWAEGVKRRNGALQYAVMASALQKETYKYFAGLNWVTGTSSPRVESYRVTESYRVDEDKYRFTVEFEYMDSTKTTFTSKAFVTVENLEGKWLVSTLEQIEVQGEITKLTFADDGKTKQIFVQGEPGIVSGYDQANVIIGKDTKIYRGYTDEELAVNLLQEGVRVAVNLTDDPRLMIYPVTAEAKTIRVFEPEESGTIVYESTKYGFSFTLPVTWQKYQVLAGEWEGLSLEEGKEGKVAARGPLLKIRHPAWTEEEPRQDIPIMVLTLKQWDDLQAGKFHIGAAPIGPQELGRNSKYVFALPARYNYAFPAGYEEVEKIMANNPLQTFTR